MNGFDALLEKITDRADRQRLAELSTKYGELREGVLRQEDYSRKMAEIQQQVAEFTEKEKVLNNWESWRKDHWDEQRGMTKREAQLVDEVGTLQNLLANTNTGEDMSPEQLQAQLDALAKQKGYLTKDEVAQLVQQEAQRFTEQHRSDLAQISSFNSSLGPLLIKHYKEYGDVLDTGEMFAAATKAGVTDLNQAYELFTTPLRNSRQEQERKAAEEAAYERGKAEALKDRGMGPNGHMPIDDGPPEMGHFQATMTGIKPAEGTPSIPEELRLGSGAVGAHVAQIYRAQKSQA